ncbi:MAG: hypothetical protein F6K22_29525 [Okeania sp. SIO2F4]|uniref:hypothetical protein n=1 Tax=Okeania sp. SIO2F4 TaxID=2607790 RepID=UPI001429B423|nr:hypothetical protein [Okeania sp. SIO2F4]NES06596.1 hypothetical protein [Okeania sp. SIO2F4]
MTTQKEFYSRTGGGFMSTITYTQKKYTVIHTDPIYTEKKYTLIQTEPEKYKQIKPKKKHLKKRAQIKPTGKAEEDLIDSYFDKSEHESFQHLLVRFIYGFVLPL